MRVEIEESKEFDTELEFKDFITEVLKIILYDLMKRGTISSYYVL